MMTLMKKMITVFALVMTSFISSAQKKGVDKSVMVNVISCETGKIVMTNIKKADVPILWLLLCFKGDYRLKPVKKPRPTVMLEGFFLDLNKLFRLWLSPYFKGH